MRQRVSAVKMTFAFIGVALVITSASLGAKAGRVDPRSTAMAFFKLETTTAWAWFVAANFGESLRLFGIVLIQDLHDLRSRRPATNQLGHDLRRFVDMLKKRFVAKAKVIQSELPIRCGEKSVLRTFPMAGKTYLALSTGKQQLVEFISSELSLPLRAN